MVKQTSQYSFLEAYIVELLNKQGFANMSEANRQELLPQFVAQAEVRLGAALLPLVTLSGAEKIKQMVEGGKTSPEQWRSFWEQEVPDFEAVTAKTLTAYGSEVAKILSR